MKDEKLAYWIGVVHADGSIVKRRFKNRICLQTLVSLQVSPKSKEMLLKFKEISEEKLGRKVKIVKLKTRNILMYQIGISEFRDKFDELGLKEKYVIPNWILNKDSLLGSYLAGIIDGDGNIRIKRKKYPQCVIRITGSFSLSKLYKLIKRRLKWSMQFVKRQRESKLCGRKIKGK